MKLKYKDFIDVNNEIGYIIIQCLSKNNVSTAQNIIDTLDKNLPIDEYEDQELDISLTVNGVEIPVDNLAKGLYDAVVQNTTKRAEDISREAFNEKYSKILEELDSLREKAEIINKEMDWDKVYSKFYEKQ